MQMHISQSSAGYGVGVGHMLPLRFPVRFDTSEGIHEPPRRSRIQGREVAPYSVRQSDFSRQAGLCHPTSGRGGCLAGGSVLERFLRQWMYRSCEIKRILHEIFIIIIKKIEASVYQEVKV